MFQQMIGNYIAFYSLLFSFNSLAHVQVVRIVVF
jgi:hypothetical protein